MKKKNIIVVSVLLLISIGIFVTYAFISTGGKQTLANSFTSGCLSITIDSESPSININGAFPVTDVEGLKGDSYSFTIRNTCNQDENYMINLESLNHSPNSLNPIYIKTALSSDTFDNIITKLNNEIETDHYVEGAYISHNLYDGTIKASETKTFNLKLWMDYDTTTEQGLNKTYQSRINVIASSKATPDDISEVLTEKKGKTVEGTITGSATSANYCTSTGNACEPNKAVSINDNKITPTLEETEKDQIVCTKLDDKKVVCSNPVNNSYCPAGATSCESILANNEVNDEILTEVTGPSCSDSTQCGNEKNMNQNGIYMAEDDDGTSYIYRGTIDNNWFKFGQTTDGEDIWWRIIRINGDGTIRLIYAGEGTSAPNNNGSNALDTKAYNALSGDNTYVGFYNQNTSTSAYPDAHEGTNPSDIAKELNTWFTTTTKLSKDYISYIDENAGFCNDRRIAISNHGSTSYTNEGFGSKNTYYAPFDRVAASTSSSSYSSTEQKSTLKCGENDSEDYARDYFTWQSKADRGNRILIQPIGLITMDEVILAGGFGQKENTGYWLYTGEYYWTMSPYGFIGGVAYVFHVGNNGYLSNTNVRSTTPGVRPVINLKSDLKIIGTGTKENPYRIDERDKLQEAGETVLANNEVKGIVTEVTGPSCNDNTKCGETNMNQNGVYESPDDDGTSYIFRGTVENNWVKFGKDKDNQDIWWRIIRINGDGTIRLIYSGEGTAPTGNGTNAINEQAFNTVYEDNTYEGYYYGTKGGNNFSATHSNTTQSSIASSTENWFTTTTKLNTEEYLKHIDENAGFCNNRQISQVAREWWTSEPTSGARGTGKVATAYKGYYKTQTTLGSWKTKQYSDLKCSSSQNNFENNVDYLRDYYTWEDHANRGNKVLDYPVGQITVDEVILAGGFGGQANSGYWLNSGTPYWTMSPDNFGGNANMLLVRNTGELTDNHVYSSTPGVRPVINLKANTNLVLEGNGTPGTVNNPYIVK